MDNAKKNISGRLIKRITQLSPFVMAGIMAVLYFTCFRGVTVNQLLHYVPSEPWLAAAIILLMFALKSLSYFFPMLILYAVTGSFFDFGTGMAINLAGTVIMVTIPYFIGRFAERELVDSLIAKSRRSDRINEMRTEGQFFSSFFLRVISCLPCDVVSLALGSAGIGYKKYLSGSLLGILPGIIAATLMGEAADDPLSPEFIGAAAINVVIAAASAIVYAVYRKKHKERKT